MTALQHLAAGNRYLVHLAESDDFEAWRERARALVPVSYTHLTLPTKA